MVANTRIEHDSFGALHVPVDVLYGAQTQRAVENFPLSGLVMPRGFIRALALIKAAIAEVNADLKLLPKNKAAAIQRAAERVALGEFDAHFPIDVFQTGSGTSSNMNANEVIAALASQALKRPIHPNDDVNCGQSSNDVIPSAIQVAASLAWYESLRPALKHLKTCIDRRAKSLSKVVKTGRTHLMDAMPLTFGQELSGWSAQIASAIERLDDSVQRLQRLPLGGTAVGTGINAHPSLAKAAIARLRARVSVKFSQATNLFEGIAAQDAAVEFSGQLTVLAVALTKISNDLRWMNSGPLAGLGEIELPALQPGSSIMPGKVNPVIPEAVVMICAQVMGNHTTVTVAGASGNFQLNTMLPVLAYNLLQSIELLASASRALADKAIAGFTVRQDRIGATLARNPILVTALNPVVGYEAAAQIAKRAYSENRPIQDLAQTMTSLNEKQLRKMLDPLTLTKGGIGSGGTSG